MDAALIQQLRNLFPSVRRPYGAFEAFRLRQIFENLVIAVARDEDDWQLGMCGVARFRELNARHFGHGKICKNEFDACRARRP
jgi:hypothetical protein